MGSSQDVRAEVLSAFDADGDSAEPHTTATIVDALDIPEELVAEHLADLADSGDLEWKDVGDSRIWWPAQSLDGRTADEKLEPEQDRYEDSPKGRAQIRSHPVFDSEMVGVIVWGEDLTVEDANDTFLQMAGLNYEEALGTSWEDLTPKEFYPASKRHISEVEESGSGVPYEKQYFHADGSRWWGLFESRQLNDSQRIELVVEISERRKREEELKAKQQFVQQSLNALEDVFYVLDTDGRLQRWNDKAKTLTGYPESELADMSVLEFFPEDEHDAIGGSIERIWTEGTATVEADVLTAAGERVPHEFRGKRLTDTDGNTTGIVGIGRDLTERRRRERRFQALVEESNDVISIVDTDGQFQYQSPSLERILGYQPSETIGDPAWEYIHPEDRETVMATFEEWLGNPEITDSIEYRAQHADGSWRWMEARGNNQLDNPAVEGYIVTSRDITDRRERQKTLEQIETLFEHAQGPLFIIDVGEEFTVERVNPAYEASTGLAREQVEGQTPTDLLGDELGAGVEDKYRECVDRRESLSYEEKLQFGEQPTYWATSIAPVVVDDTVKYIVGSTKDVTERVEREQELENLKTQYQTLAENFPDGAVYLIDSDLKCVRAGGEELSKIGLSPDDVEGTKPHALFPEEIADELCHYYEEALDGNANTFEQGYGGKRYRIQTVPIRTDGEEIDHVMAVSENITERKERERALEKRERILRALNTATREFHPPESEVAIAEFLVEFVEAAFEFEYVSVKRFDEQEGVLQSPARSSEHEETGEVGPVEPSSSPIWEVYRHSDPQLFDGELLEENDSLDVPANQVLAVPIGEFGVLVTFTTGDSEFDDVDMDLIEVVTTNAESAFQRLRSDSVRTELVDELSVQQTRVAELRSVIDTVQAIQRRLASSESQDALETGVCEELLETESIDFVWVGRPRTRDTDLRPTAWAGDGSGYLDSIETGTPDKSVPAQRAAADRESYCQQNIPSLVVDEAWAKDTLSVGFHSVLSVPLVYDDVLYGVLTAYSRDEDAFGQIYQHLLTNVASLLVNYGRLLDNRFGDAQREYTALKFELSDPTYPLQRLASNTDSRIRFNTVAENMTDGIRILGTVLDGDPERVLDAASSIPSIVDAEQFGDDDQFSLTVQKPFLASVVGKHGGELVHAVSDEASTRFRVEVPGTTTKRPLLDALLSRYQSIELVTQRQTDTPRVPATERVADILTDRQYEILNAAYHGGYYETPRGVSGENLAESFDISGPAVYNHLQSAHRALLETVMQQESDINDERVR